MWDYYFIISGVIYYMSYSELKESLSEVLGLVIKEKPLQASDGRISGHNIAIREDMESDTAKKCVLLEEVGHFLTTVGDISRLHSVDEAKQERRARRWAYDISLPMDRLYAAQEAGCSEIWEAAAWLGVTEKFLSDALCHYEHVYGPAAYIGPYYVRFGPLRIERRCQ